jgi:hypothetical protein
LEQYCKKLGNADISAKLALTAKYLTGLDEYLDVEGYYTVKGCDVVCITMNPGDGNFIDVDTSRVAFEVLANFVVRIPKHLTNVEALIPILWLMTMYGWPDGFYTWLVYAYGKPLNADCMDDAFKTICDREEIKTE